MINGTDYREGVYEAKEGFDEYAVEATLAAGDEVQLYDNVNKATWVVEPEGSGYTDFTKDWDNQKYIITNAGLYQFYIKIYTQTATSGLYVAYQQPTSVKTVLTNEQVCKFVQDGQLVIVREGVRYNAVGARVK